MTWRQFILALQQIVKLLDIAPKRGLCPLGATRGNLRRRRLANGHAAGSTPYNVSRGSHARFPHSGPLPREEGDKERPQRDFHGNRQQRQAQCRKLRLFSEQPMMLSGFVGCLEYELDYDSDPALEAKTTDTTLRLKLGYEW